MCVCVCVLDVYIYIYIYIYIYQALFQEFRRMGRGLNFGYATSTHPSPPNFPGSVTAALINPFISLKFKKI